MKKFLSHDKCALQFNWQALSHGGGHGIPHAALTIRQSSLLVPDGKDFK
jgi:hypothetical protein